MVLLCLIGVVAWVWLVFCLAFLTRLRLVGKIVVAVVAGIAVGISFTGFAAAMGLIPIDPTANRWWWMFANSLLVVLFYLCLALGLVAVVALVVRVLAGPLPTKNAIDNISTVQSQDAPTQAGPTPNADMMEGEGWVEEDTGDSPPRTAIPRRTRVVRVLCVLSIVVAMCVTAYGYVAALRPQITHYTVANSQLPSSFEGFTIALVTDIHLGATVDGQFVSRLVDQINAERPDLIVIAGDLVDGTPDQLGPEIAVLSRLSAPYGVIVTTGNHEFYWGAKEWMAAFADLGLTTLDNEGIQIVADGDSIDILGIEDSSGTGNMAPDVTLASSRMAETFDTPPSGTGRYRILIAHRPSEAARQDGAAARLGVDLQLSGHTHGGQVWPLQLFTELAQGTVGGEAELSGITVVTSRGVASWGPPVRVGSTPEVPIITLTQG
ncbi:MAG: metallophosphoesterase [Propionibacteriaceae bacterium]|jgi:predicted MPP superfamily phosphohydrolase|nr:metallophosphoesterase [Propionibacteriaceae bacterium]